MKNSSCPSVSVLIPLFRVEPYVARCLRSVLLQEYANINIVIIDDASPDNSASIAKLILETENIHGFGWNLIKHEVNKGIGAIRCELLAHATGDYVLFIDSDDYWSDSYVVGNWVTLAEKGKYDVVIANYRFIYEASTKEVSLTPNPTSKGVAYEMLKGSVDAFFHNKLFSRNVYTYIMPLLAEGRNLWEDITALVPLFYYKVSRVGYLNQVVYNYVQYNGSAITKQRNTKYISSTVELIHFWEQCFRESLQTDSQLANALWIASMRFKERLFRAMPLKYYSLIRSIPTIGEQSLQCMPWGVVRKLLFRISLCRYTAFLSHTYYILSARFHRFFGI